VLGTGVACAGAGAAAAVGGACWHPATVKPKAVMATAARNLKKYGFICFVLFSVSAYCAQVHGHSAFRGVSRIQWVKPTP
jgi:hypothetical protein